MHFFLLQYIQGQNICYTTTYIYDRSASGSLATCIYFYEHFSNFFSFNLILLPLSNPNSSSTQIPFFSTLSPRCASIGYLTMGLKSLHIQFQNLITLFIIWTVPKSSCLFLVGMWISKKCLNYICYNSDMSHSQENSRRR